VACCGGCRRQVGHALDARNAVSQMCRRGNIPLVPPGAISQYPSRVSCVIVDLERKTWSDDEDMDAFLCVRGTARRPAAAGQACDRRVAREHLGSVRLLVCLRFHALSAVSRQAREIFLRDPRLLPVNGPTTRPESTDSL
jgi:hypothetical protein